MKAELLIVDDEEYIRKMLSRHFTYLGYGINLAENGLAALEVLTQKRIDVVISDIKMPKMTGVELLRVVRTEFPMTRVVMITGYVTLQNALDCMENQADDVVFKPLTDLGELETAVDHSLSRILNWRRKLRILHGMRSLEMSMKGDHTAALTNGVADAGPEPAAGNTPRRRTTRRLPAEVVATDIGLPECADETATTVQPKVTAPKPKPRARKAVADRATTTRKRTRSKSATTGKAATGKSKAAVRKAQKSTEKSTDATRKKAAASA